MYNIIEIKKKEDYFLVSILLNDNTLIIKKVNEHELLQMYYEFDKIVKEIQK